MVSLLVYRLLKRMDQEQEFQTLLCFFSCLSCYSCFVFEIIEPPWPLRVVDNNIECLMVMNVRGTVLFVPSHRWLVLLLHIGPQNYLVMTEICQYYTLYGNSNMLTAGSKCLININLASNSAFGVKTWQTIPNACCVSKI